MDFWQVLEGRRSVRAFKTDPVPRDVIERLLAGAGLAPSVLNSQPWDFHVCTGASRIDVGETLAQATTHLDEYMEVLGKEHYEEAVRWYSSLGDAPVVIVTAMKTPEEDFDCLNLTLSVGAALENLLLAAKAESLAACNITFGWWVRDEIKTQLGIPEGQSVASVVALGYPAVAETVAPPRRECISVWHD